MKEMENVQKKKDEEKAMEIMRVDPTPDVEDISDKPEPVKISDPKIPEVPTNPIPMPSIVLPPPMPGMPPAPPALMFRPGMFRPGIPAPMRPGLRMPPGPPTGPRPMHALRAPMGHHKHHPGPSQSSKDPKSATITAKPQIRNLSADVTRFVPTTLRVKRDDSYKKPKPPKMYHEQQQQVNKGPTKDDAYMQFMNEMQGLL
jgi:WW domain-binding protein 11